MMIPAGPVPADTLHATSNGCDDRHHRDERRDADDAKFEKVRLAEEPGAHAAENDRRCI